MISKYLLLFLISSLWSFLNVYYCFTQILCKYFVLHVMLEWEIKNPWILLCVIYLHIRQNTQTGTNSMLTLVKSYIIHSLNITLLLWCSSISIRFPVGLTWTGMNMQGRGQRHRPPGSVAAGRPPPVTREPPSGVRRPSPLPEDTQEEMCHLQT